MPAGRTPKPLAIKILAGNPGCRPLNRNEPMPSGKMPKCPTWLDTIGKAKWKRLAPELHRIGVLTEVDGDLLAAYCQAWAEFQIATRTVRREGRNLTTRSGYMQPHPAVAQMRTAWAAMQQFASRFGLDPSSRTRLHVERTEDEEPDALDELLRRKAEHRQRQQQEQQQQQS